VHEAVKEATVCSFINRDEPVIRQSCKNCQALQQSAHTWGVNKYFAEWDVAINIMLKYLISNTVQQN